MTPQDTSRGVSHASHWTLWRDRLTKLAIINAKGNPREQFRRIRVTLQTLGL